MPQERGRVLPVLVPVRAQVPQGRAQVPPAWVLEPGPELLARRPGRFRGQRRASGARNRRKGLLRRVGE